MQQLDEQEDEEYMNKKSKSNKKDLITNVNSIGEEDDYYEEMETSQYDYAIWKQILFIYSNKSFLQYKYKTN